MAEHLKPLVCICVPTYNAANTISDTLRSICGQSYHNLVVKVVDNASSDGTAEIVSDFPDKRVRLERNVVNIGAEANFTRCIELGEGSYTAIYHADDLYEPDMVERQVAFLEEHLQAGAVFTEASLIDESGNSIGVIKTPASLTKSFDDLYSFEMLFKAVLKNSNFLICPSLMARTPIYQNEIRKWRGEMFGSGADLDVWLRISQSHPVGIIRRPLMCYRIGDSQGSAKVRLSTERGALFAIVDYYLQDDEVRALVTARDLENYLQLDRRDRVARAVNLFIAGKTEEAKVLCADVWSLDAFTAALQTRRSLLVLAVGSVLRFLIFFGLNRFGRALLKSIKRMARR